VWRQSGRNAHTLVRLETKTLPLVPGTPHLYSVVSAKHKYSGRMSRKVMHDMFLVGDVMFAIPLYYSEYASTYDTYPSKGRTILHEYGVICIGRYFMLKFCAIHLHQCRRTIVALWVLQLLPFRVVRVR
jgi:hypothetical protein